MTDSSSQRQLAEFAEAAVLHAADVHGIELTAHALASVDTILDRERTDGDADHRESLALCYGCWLGQLAIRRFGATWVGLHESIAPRLSVNGVICSPIDAIRRRLLDGRAPTVEQLVNQLETWSRRMTDSTESSQGNRSAWDGRAGDPRFVNFRELPPDANSARAAIDPWLRDEGIEGCRLLCLAAGGGTHGPLHAIAGGQVTIVDVSEQQLQIDKGFANRYGIDLRTIQASMDQLDALDDDSFDCVLQPVSTCYVRDLERVYQEVARVLRTGGLYIVQHKQPASLQASGISAEPARILYPAEAGFCLPPSEDESLVHRETDTTEYIHPLAVVLGGLCHAGFVIEDVQEPPRADAWAPVGSFEHRARFLPPYLKIKARRC
ncbi:MAG: class I SAM-dependent methyltransferase [Planctomycetes bacterium]|nr:class I SAM-dependent methyltransferase [Planctomycetota bacterium]